MEIGFFYTQALHINYGLFCVIAIQLLSFIASFALVLMGRWPDTSNDTLHGAHEWGERMSFGRRR